MLHILSQAPAPARPSPQASAEEGGPRRFHVYSSAKPDTLVGPIHSFYSHSLLRRESGISILPFSPRILSFDHSFQENNLISANTDFAFYPFTEKRGGKDSASQRAFPLPNPAERQGASRAHTQYQIRPESRSGGGQRLRQKHSDCIAGEVL